MPPEDGAGRGGAPRLGPKPVPVAAAVLAADRARLLAAHPVSRETLARLDRFAALLLKWQRTTNLVAPSTLPHLWTRHFGDSLQLARLAPGPRRWADLGSGGGFPGLVMAIAKAGRAGAHIDLVESNAKKAAFLRAAIRETEAPAVAHARRIEDCGDVLAEADAVSARALAPLADLLRLVAGRLRPGVPCFFAKGRQGAQEILDASAHWRFAMVQHPSDIEAGSVILEIRDIAPKGAAPEPRQG